MYVLGLLKTHMEFLQMILLYSGRNLHCLSAIKIVFFNSSFDNKKGILFYLVAGMNSEFVLKHIRIISSSATDIVVIHVFFLIKDQTDPLLSYTENEVTHPAKPREVSGESLI